MMIYVANERLATAVLGTDRVYIVAPRAILDRSGDILAHIDAVGRHVDHDCCPQGDANHNADEAERGGFKQEHPQSHPAALSSPVRPGYPLRNGCQDGHQQRIGDNHGNHEHHDEVENQ